MVNTHPGTCNFQKPELESAQSAPQFLQEYGSIEASTVVHVTP